MENNVKTTIIYFSKKNGEEIKLKDCPILREFIYNRQNFTLIEKNNTYWVCINGKNDYLYSIWSINKVSEGEKIQINSVLSRFRREYDKNGINSVLIENFLKNPLKYAITKKKK